jgi:hypothetical protein
MEDEDEESPLWKHCTIYHSSRHVQFEIEVTGVHRTAMERLTDEIVRIKHTNSKIVLNSKNYWAQPALVRVIPVTGNSQDRQAGDTQPTRQERSQMRQQQRQQQQTGETAAPQRRRRARTAAAAETGDASRQTQTAATQGDRNADRTARRLRRDRT